jgi:post-segregation antitoxin (ccd killing protein)
MVRLQIQLEPSAHRAVKRRARQLGVSVSEVIRRSVAAELGRESAETPAARARRALSVAGKYRDPAGAIDIAAKHDDALADAFRR